jgi:hypothetical protein
MNTNPQETSFRNRVRDKIIQTSASISSIKEKIHNKAEQKKPSLTGAERIVAVSRLSQNLKLSTISPAGTPQYIDGVNSQMTERLYHILYEKTEENVTLDEERIDFIRLLAKNYERTVMAEKYKLLGRNTTLGYRTHIKERITEIIRNLQNYTVENVADMLTRAPTSLSVEIVAEILDLDVSLQEQTERPRRQRQGQGQEQTERPRRQRQGQGQGQGASVRPQEEQSI